MPRPLPSSAVSLYSYGDLLFAQFTTPSGNVAEVSFQTTPTGLAALARFLREREIAASRATKYATPAAPIQHIVDSWQRGAEDKIQKAAERAERERFKTKPRKEQIEELTRLFEEDFGR